MLMDIRMPGMDGLEAAKRLLHSRMPPAVIFTTAHEEHALQAFESQAVDYLLKPVRKSRLLQALEAAQRVTLMQLEAVARAASDPAPQLTITYRGGMRRLSLDQVFYLQADSKYVSVVHKDGELLLEESLKSLESRFGNWLIRVHRNALVARHALVGLEKNTDGVMRVRIRGCENMLTVSRRHLPEIRRLMKSEG